MYTPRSRQEALAIYRKLFLCRHGEEAIIREYPSDEIRTPVHLGVGLEGIAVGVCHALPPTAKSFGQLRNHCQYLALCGHDPRALDAFFAELYGKVTGVGQGRAGSMHLAWPDGGLVSTSGIVGSTISLAVGAALAAKYRGTDEVAVAMFGDAAIEEGEFWESLNFACLHKLRVLFVCEDNDLAIHTFAHQRRGFKSIPDVMRGFDCHVFDGDGTNVLKVIGAIQTALQLQAQDPRPVFACFRWFRFLEHCGPNTDFNAGYRPKPDDAILQALDPIANYELWLARNGYDSAELRVVRDEVIAEVERSIAAAKAAPYPADLFKEVIS